MEGIVKVARILAGLGYSAIVLNAPPALANGAPPRVKIDPSLTCETATGASVTIEAPSIGDSDAVDVWEGPIRRSVPIAEITLVVIAGKPDDPATAGVVVETTSGQTIEGELKLGEGAQRLTLTGRERDGAADVEIDLAGCVRLVAAGQADASRADAPPDHGLRAD